MQVLISWASVSGFLATVCPSDKTHVCPSHHNFLGCWQHFPTYKSYHILVDWEVLIILYCMGYRMLLILSQLLCSVSSPSSTGHFQIFVVEVLSVPPPGLGYHLLLPPWIIFGCLQEYWMHQSNKHLGNTSRHCDSRNKQHRLCIYHDCFLKCLTAVNKTHMLQLCLYQDMDKCLVLAFHIGQ